MSTESTRAHQDVLNECLQVFIDRNRKYNDTWKTYGAKAQLVRAAQKVDRMMEVWWHENEGDYSALEADVLDDAIDAINHLVFFIRCAREANFTGAAPERVELRNGSGEVVRVITSHAHEDPYRRERFEKAKEWVLEEHGETLRRLGGGINQCVNPNCPHEGPHWHQMQEDPLNPGNALMTTHWFS